MQKYSVRPSIPKEAGENLRDYPELTRGLLFSRGIGDAEEAEKFFNPDYESHAHDPFLLAGMDRAADRIISAVKNGEKICIYSDYDADGIPGAVILHDFFKKIGVKNLAFSGRERGKGVGETGVSPSRNTGRSPLGTEGFLNKAYPNSNLGGFMNYIPHRRDEGFGLNLNAVNEIADGGAKLLITVDCGVADAEEIGEANRRGMEVIITDHHLPNGELPEAFAILNPKLKDSTYPFKELCGSAVAYKLVQAVLSRERFGMKEGMEKWLLDMVGLATLADMVPLTGENRMFAHYGLKVMRKSPRIGMQKLLAKLRINQRHITEDDIGFMIAPRINAASRMGLPDDAFNLLATDDEAVAGELAEHLDRINSERKGVVASMVKEIRKIIAERSEKETMKKIVVIGNPMWKPALLGLAANSLVDDHDRPVFVWGREADGSFKGSCRSCGKVNMLELMKAVSPGVFADFGGHKMSGGFTVTDGKIHSLEDELLKALEKAGKESAPDADFVDAALSLERADWKTYSEIEKFAPFGVGNPKPVFLFENAEIAGVKKFGKAGDHWNFLSKRRTEKKFPPSRFFPRRNP